MAGIRIPFLEPLREAHRNAELRRHPLKSTTCVDDLCLTTARAHAHRLGHLNLRVSNLDRAIAFYSRLGFRVVRRRPGSPIAFLALDDSGVFQLGLSVAGRQDPAPNEDAPGFDHFALAYDTPVALARACSQLLDDGVELVAAHEHGISKSVYFSDPDRNEVELLWEYPPEQWPPDEENFRMRPLDLDELLALADD